MNICAALLLVLGQIDTVASDDFPPQLQVSAVCASVRILNATNKFRGTGAVLRTSGPFVYLLTAEHVVAGAERLEVSTFSAASYPRPDNTYFSADVVTKRKDQDVALLRLPTRDPMPGSLRICPPGLVPREKTVPVMSVGCSNGEAPTCLIDRVLGSKRVRKEAGGGVSLVWELSRQHAPGRSGGPLLDKRGDLIGVCSGTTPEKGYYCHIDEIHAWLKKSGYAWLCEEPKP